MNSVRPLHVIVLFYGVLLALATAVEACAPLIAPQMHWATEPLRAAGLLAAAVAASAVAVKFGGLRPGDAGYSKPARLRDVRIGGALGAGGVSLIAGFLWLGGAVIQPGGRSTRDVLCGMATTGGAFLAAAAFEELVFRGVAFHVLRAFASPPTVAVLSALPFAAAHADNPHVTPLAVTNTFLAGAWFAVARLRFGDLWFATSAHAAWNFASAWLWGAPVSGRADRLGASVFTLTTHGPRWLDGGDYGLEGGVLASFVLAGAIFLTIRCAPRFPESKTA
jgi:hypothetical protein